MVIVSNGDDTRIIRFRNRCRLIDVLLFAHHQPNQIKEIKVDVYQSSRAEDEVSSTGLKSFLFGNSMFALIPVAKIAQLPDGDDDGLSNHNIQTYTSEELAKNRPDLYLFLVNQGIINADGILRNDDFNIPNAIEFVYWSKSKGYIRLDEYDNTIWQLKEKKFNESIMESKVENEAKNLTETIKVSA